MSTVTTTEIQTAPPSTVTDNIVSTLTQDITTTTTSQVEIDIFCGGANLGGGACECTYTVTCGASYTSTSNYASSTVPEFSDCLAMCDNDTNCSGAQYQTSARIYTLFSGFPHSTPADSDYDIAVWNEGGCQAVCPGN